MKRLFMIVLALCSMLYAADQSAPSVTLTGTVKDSATPLEGVTITLAKIKTLSTLTKADGSFTLTNVTGVVLPEKRTASYGFSFRNNTVVFTGGSEKVSGAVSLNAVDGRQIFAFALDNFQAGDQSFALPALSPGMYLLAGTVNGESFTRSLVCMGNSVYLKNETTANGGGSLFLGKSATAAVADTLIASKDGYDTNRTAITSYTKDGLAIAMKKKGAGGFTITSTKFKEGDKMPDAYTCEGKSFFASIAPPLAWSGAPAGTKSYALTFLDLTILATPQPTNAYHWAMWNIPDTITQLPEGFGGDKYNQKGGSNKFFGPCPSGTNTTRAKDTYAFTLYTFKDAKISPTSTSVQTLVAWFGKNAVDSTKISVWSDAKATGF